MITFADLINEVQADRWKLTRLLANLKDEAKAKEKQMVHEREMEAVAKEKLRLENVQFRLKVKAQQRTECNLRKLLRSAYNRKRVALPSPVNVEQSAIKSEALPESLPKSLDFTPMPWSMSEELRNKIESLCA